MTPSTPLIMPPATLRSSFRRVTRLMAGLGAAGLAAGLAACADATAPRNGVAEGRPNFATVSEPTLVDVLTRSAPLPAAIKHSFTVSSAGGKYDVPGTGLRVEVPAKAVSTKLTITVTAFAGDLVAYDFQPHGTVFSAPVVLHQDIKSTNYYKLVDPSRVEGGYFADNTQLDFTNKKAVVNEFLPITVDAATSKIKFGVKHFSGYMLASGRVDDSAGY